MNRPGGTGLRHVPTVIASVLFLVGLGLSSALFAGRKPGFFRSQSIIDWIPEFYTHISNFSISYLVVAGVGYTWLMMGARLRSVMWLGGAVVGANVIYEGLIPIINTTDMVDAVYGIVGVALGLVVLWLVYRYGLQPAPTKET